jgi:hypothetical protein
MYWHRWGRLSAGAGIAKNPFVLSVSVFNKEADSDAMLVNINDPLYFEYAPSTTVNGCELYFTRTLKTGSATEICVSVRNSVTDVFGAPKVIAITGNFIFVIFYFFLLEINAGVLKPAGITT